MEQNQFLGEATSMDKIKKIFVVDQKKYFFKYSPDDSDERGTVTIPDGLRFWCCRCEESDPNGLKTDR